MFLSEPGKTPYDLSFNFLGFPCRVHPAFFVLPVLFGAGVGGGDINAGVGILLMAVVFFVSILVHELGHALAFRYYGIASRVVLYWMGGLAIPDSGGWGGGRQKALTPDQQIVVSGAGPAAGLLLALVAALVLVALGSTAKLGWAGPVPIPQFQIVEGSFLATYPALRLVLLMFVVVNIFLNLLNLLPVYPLDGGQISRQLLVKADPWGGVRNSVIVSIAVSALVALLAFKYGESFIGFFFGFMAWNNFQVLQQGGNSRRPW